MGSVLFIYELSFKTVYLDQWFYYFAFLNSWSDETSFKFDRASVSHRLNSRFYPPVSFALFLPNHNQVQDKVIVDLWHENLWYRSFPYLYFFQISISDLIPFWISLRLISIEDC